MTCRIPAFNPVPWSDLFPMVQVSAPTAPVNIIEHQIRQAAIEFLSRSLALEHDLFLDTQAGVRDYGMSPPDGYRVHMVRQLCVGCREFAGLSKPPCDDMPCNSYWFGPPSSLLVAHDAAEDAREEITVRAVLVPTQSSCYIDRDIFERYGEVIAEGALSRVLIMPNAAWYNTGSAGIMLRRFNLGVNRAKNDKGREFSGPKLMLAPRFV